MALAHIVAARSHAVVLAQFLVAPCQKLMLGLVLECRRDAHLQHGGMGKLGKIQAAGRVSLREEHLALLAWLAPQVRTRRCSAFSYCPG